MLGFIKPKRVLILVFMMELGWAVVLYILFDAAKDTSHLRIFWSVPS